MNLLLYGRCYSDIPGHEYMISRSICWLLRWHIMGMGFGGIMFYWLYICENVGVRCNWEISSWNLCDFSQLIRNSRFHNNDWKLLRQNLPMTVTQISLGIKSVWLIEWQPTKAILNQQSAQIHEHIWWRIMFVIVFHHNIQTTSLFA